GRLMASEGAQGADRDAELRPEGETGRLVRSLSSYQSYYAKWSQPWEAQALLRARPVAGEDGLIDDFLPMIDPLRYPAEMSHRALTQGRTLKARLEGARLPRNADNRRHRKPGRGRLSDVEWTVQLMQLERGHELAGLRTTSTLGASEAATEAGLLSAEDSAQLAAAWTMATEVRSAVML